MALNGIDPIIIFQFKKLDPTQANAFASVYKIPIATAELRYISFPPIPIYLSETLTGLFIDSEDKNIDIETSAETLQNGGDPIFYQRGLNSTVKINITASRDSIGLTLLAAMSDLIFDKVTSKEYSITYLHGAITVFNGLVHSFSITQNSDNDLYNISLELTRSTVKTNATSVVPEVSKSTGSIPLVTP